MANMKIEYKIFVFEEQAVASNSRKWPAFYES
jgi:hypothetical protein